MVKLIKNTYLVAGSRTDPQDGLDIVIDGNLISDIGKDLHSKYPNADVIDGSERIAIPGFVNAHTHSNESFEQGFYDALPLEVWLLWKYPPFATPKLPERVHYLRTMLLAIECVRSGITTVQDDLINGLADPAAFDGSAAAYRDLGLRASITVSMSDVKPLDFLLYTDDLMGQDVRDAYASAKPLSWQEHIGLFHRHFDKWNNAGNGRIRVILGPLGPQWCSDALLQETTRISLSRGLPVHAHTLESKMHTVQAQTIYGKSMIEHLSETGILTPHFTLNHAVWLTDEDIAMLGAAGSCITHNPLSNLKLGSGVARIKALRNAGVPVGLGTDGTSTSDRADMFRSLGLAAMLHRIADLDYSTWLDADDAFEMATTGAARTAGLQKDIGEIKVGMKADLSLVDRYDYGLIPLKRPRSQLAYGVNSDAVQTVFVDGEIVMFDRKLMKVDETTLKLEIREEAERYLRDNVPLMEAAVPKFEPYFRAAHLRSAGEIVPASRAPVWLGCTCHITPLRHTCTVV